MESSPTSTPPVETPTYYDAAREHEFSAANTLLLVMVLLCSTGFGFFMKKHHHMFKNIPESAMSILIGILAGLFVRVVYPQDQRPVLDFKPQLFFFVLLPLIIFDAGYTLKKKRFFSNFGTIMLFAVFGTLISTLIVGSLTYAFASIGWIPIENQNPLQSLMFGALISSVDPVATLSIMGDPSLNIDPLLYSLVFGESVLNDVVAIVLFRVFLEYVEMQHLHPDTTEQFSFGDLGNVLFQFVAILIGSVLIGIACGLLCSFVFKKTNLHKYHRMEIQVLFLTAFGCFALSELLFMSGVMSIFFCAVTLSHYNFYNLSLPSKITSMHISESLASTAETVVMIYIGMSMFSSYTHWDVGFIFLGLLFCFVGRAFNIFPLSFLANLGRTHKISRNMQVVIFFAGLRGAVSYALSMQLTGSGSEKSVEIVQTTTLMIIIITTLGLGGSTEPVLRLFKMQNGPASGVSPSSTAPDNFPTDSHIVLPLTSNDNQLREDFIGRSFGRREQNDSGQPQAAIFTDDNAADDAMDDDVSFIIGHGDGSTSNQGIALRSWARLDILYLRPIFGGRRPRYNVDQFPNISSPPSGERSQGGRPSSPSLANATYVQFGEHASLNGASSRTKIFNDERSDSDNPFQIDSEARL